MLEKFYPSSGLWDYENPLDICLGGVRLGCIVLLCPALSPFPQKQQMPLLGMFAEKSLKKLVV